MLGPPRIAGGRRPDPATPGCVRSAADHGQVDPIALTTTDKIQLAIAGITGLATLIALANVVVTNLIERRRTQPIMIAHGAGDRRLAHGTDAAWLLESYITSEGAGPAFNVRYGVEIAGVRYPYRLNLDDPASGNVQRVLRPGE